MFLSSFVAVFSSSFFGLQDSFTATTYDMFFCLPCLCVIGQTSQWTRLRCEQQTTVCQPFLHRLLWPRLVLTAAQRPWQPHQLHHHFNLPPFWIIALSFRLSLQLSQHHCPPCCLPFVTMGGEKIQRCLEIKLQQFYPLNCHHP